MLVGVCICACVGCMCECGCAYVCGCLCTCVFMWYAFAFSMYTVVNCGNPSALPNGNINYTNTNFGSTVTYSCNIGYILNGMNTSTCQSSGTYTTAPVCACESETDCIYTVEYCHQC